MRWLLLLFIFMASVQTRSAEARLWRRLRHPFAACSKYLLDSQERKASFDEEDIENLLSQESVVSRISDSLREDLTIHSQSLLSAWFYFTTDVSPYNGSIDAVVRGQQSFASKYDLIINETLLGSDGFYLRVTGEKLNLLSAIDETAVTRASATMGYNDVPVIR